DAVRRAVRTGRSALGRHDSGCGGDPAGATVLLSGAVCTAGARALVPEPGSRPRIPSGTSVAEHFMSAAVCRADSAKDAWYLLHTRPRQEFRACRQLENQGYACFLPTCEIAVSAHAKRRQAPLFSRYLLIRLNAVRGNWDPIR